LATAEWTTMETSKKERRGSAPLPATTAASVEAARKEASRVIREVLQHAGSRPPVAAAATAGETMETSNTGSASIPYRNFHSEGAADGTHPLPPVSGRHEFIRIQRQIRSEHAASSIGPAAKNFKCSSFEEDKNCYANRIQLVEDAAELMVSTTSFTRSDWICTSCDVGHKLLPCRRNKPQWNKGRKLVILADHNFPAALPSIGERCPAIIRVECGLLSELGDHFFSMLRDFTLPEGSVLLIGSLTHLMEEGLVGYAKSLGAEYRRFSKLFDYTVHVIPFVPPPHGGTNDPDLVMNIFHITTWMDRVQRWNMTPYNAMIRNYAATAGPKDDHQPQKTQRHKMPVSYDTFGDYVLMCHPVESMGHSLPLMCPRNEQILVNSLLKELSVIFKWELDVAPLSLRELDGTTAPGPCKAEPRTDPVIIGGSNAGRLHDAFKDLGKTVESLDASGWCISKPNMDALLPILEENLGRLPESVPVILYCLDNSCFKAMNRNGDLLSFTKSKKDHLYHVVGDLVVTPFSLLSVTLDKLERVIAACGNRRIFILSVLPRYFLKSCCEDVSHCANVCRHDETAVEAGKKLLTDLETLNQQLAARLNGRNTQFLFTGDLLSGKQHCRMGDLVDCLYNCWRNDSVHGDKSAYLKLAMALLDFLEPKMDPNDPRLPGRKRRRPVSPGSAEQTRGCEERPDRQDDREDRGQRYRSRSTYSSYPGDFRRPGGNGGGRRF
jgi:hypothetical protein